MNFQQFYNNGYFKVSALVPVGERRSVKREEGIVNAPPDTNRMRVLGSFISRYTDQVGLWVKRNERTYVVRWIETPRPKKETQQEFSFNEAFKISPFYKSGDVSKLRKQYPNLQDKVKVDPDSLLDSFNTKTRGDSVTYGFQGNKGYVSKQPNVGHETMNIGDFTASGRAGFIYIDDVMVPVVSFWNDYNDIKPLLGKTFDLIRKVNPKFPKDKNVIIATRDRVGWYDNIEKAVSSEDRAREMELRRKLHTEVDPRRKKIYMQMLGMLPQMRKPAMAVSGD